MNTYEIRPLEGVDELKFGMSPDEVHATLGSPIRTRKFGKGDTVKEDYADLVLTFAGGSLEEITLSPRAQVKYRDIDIFAARDAVKRLTDIQRKLGHPPLGGLGFIVFPTLGIALTDFSDDHTADRAVSVFVRGRWDGLKGIEPI